MANFSDESVVTSKQSFIADVWFESKRSPTGGDRAMGGITGSFMGAKIRRTEEPRGVEKTRFAKMLTGLFFMTALVPLPVLAGKQQPTLTVNPIQAGSIAVTQPTAIGKGFGPGKRYYLGLVAGEVNASASKYIGGWATADKRGNINWPLQQDPVYGVPDAVLAPPSATLTAYNSNWTQVATTTFPVAANPGACAVSPMAARPGISLTMTGSGSQPGARLWAEWYDATGCTCWLAGCYDCTRTLNGANLTADANGNFSGTFTPSPQSNGYCVNPLTILDETSGEIVATSYFNLCP